MPITRQYRSWQVVLAACTVAVGVSTGQAGTPGLHGGDPAPPLLRRVLQHDDIEREYYVHLPAAGMVPGHTPLLVAIHGYTSTATGFAAHYGIGSHADEAGFMVVYPQGSHFMVDTPRGAWRVTSWNDLAANGAPTDAGPHCTEDREPYPRPPECTEFGRCAWTSCHDDVGFINAMLDRVLDEFSPDTQRIYVLGVSNGGMMALRLGCDMPRRFAAVVSIIGQLAPGYACAPGVDIPLMHLYGAEDDTVRFDGRPGGDGFVYTTAEDTAATWAQGLNCTQGPAPWSHTLAEAAGVACSAWSGCRQAGHEVVSCVAPNGRHEWPAQSVPGIPATCVTTEQFASMPGQAHCGPASGERQRAGMDLVWSFLRRYQASVTAAEP